MNGRVFAHALLQTTGEELRAVYALLFKTNIVSMMTAKTKDWLSKDTDHFNESLQAEVKKLARYSDAELQVKLLTEMVRALELKGLNYHHIRDIESQSEAIVQALHEQMLKDHKDYETFIDLADEQEAYPLIIQYQMQKLFSAFHDKFRELNEEHSKDFTEKIKKTLTDLPPEKQHILKQKLDIDEFTNEAIRSAILTQGSIVVLSAIVEIASFSAYITLTTAIAATMALMGVTLPFGVYTLATTLFSMLINPFILIPLALGGGGVLLKHQNKSLKKKLLPVGVLQITLPIIAQNRIGQVDSEPFIKHWQQQVERYEELLTKRAEYKEAIVKKQEEMIKHEEDREHHVREMEANKEKVETYKAFIGKYITTVPEQDRTPILQEGIEWLTSKEQELLALDERQEENRGRKGLWNVITSTIDHTKLHVQKKQIQKELDEKRSLLAEAFLEIDSSVLQTERHYVQVHQASVAAHRDKAFVYDEHATKSKEKLKELKIRLKITNEQIGALQDEYYGLEDI